MTIHRINAPTGGTAAGRNILLAAAITVFGLGIGAEAGFAHGQCEADRAELEQQIADIGASIEKEKRSPGGRHQRRMTQGRVSKLEAELSELERHMAEAKLEPCLDKATLEGQVQELKHKLETHTH